MNLITNSNFEAWLDANPNGKIEDFKFDFKKANSSNGSLFDLPKLLNISKNYLSRLTKEEIYDKTIEYTKEYDKDFYEIISKYSFCLFLLSFIKDSNKRTFSDSFSAGFFSI